MCFITNDFSKKMFPCIECHTSVFLVLYLREKKLSQQRHPLYSNSKIYTQILEILVSISRLT